MFEKPCGRAGCQNVIRVKAPYLLRRRQFCSVSCGTQARMARGWVPHAYITPASRERGRIKAIAVSNHNRHMRALERAVAECERLIPAAMRNAWDARDLALVRVLMGKAFRCGILNGENRERLRRIRAEEKVA